MKNKYLLILIFVSLLPLIPLLLPGLPITHDGRDHVARIANFYQSLSEGNLVPRWAGNLNWGFGHPILMFLYPLPSYIGSLFHFVGFSFIDSTKLVFALAYVLSGVTMFLWLQTLFSKKAAFVGALLYLFAPYRFVDMYIRGAIGEHVAFVFAPLIFYYLQKLKDSNRNGAVLWGSLSLCGLILAHNAISLMFLPLFFIYGLYILLGEKKKLWLTIKFALIGFFGFALSAFFWMPAFLEGKYTLRDIVIAMDFSERLYPLQMFLYSPWGFGTTGGFSLQVGIFHWLALIGGGVVTYLLYKKRNKLWILTCLSVVGFVAVLFLMIPSSLFLWEKISLIQKFQFPWRFLTLTVFFTAFLGTVVAEKFLVKKTLLYVVIASLIVIVTIPYWKVNGYLKQSDEFFSKPFESTTDTGESAPIWSVRFMEEFPTTPVEVIDGTATITQLQRQTERHQYTVFSSNSAQLRENTLYFPGWEVLIDGKEAQVEFQNPEHRGVMTFPIEKGKHTVEVVFTETKLRLLANGITVISLCILGLLVILNKYHIWRRYQ